MSAIDIYATFGKQPVKFFFAPDEKVNTLNICLSNKYRLDIHAIDLEIDPSLTLNKIRDHFRVDSSKDLEIIFDAENDYIFHIPSDLQSVYFTLRGEKILSWGNSLLGKHAEECLAGITGAMVTDCFQYQAMLDASSGNRQAIESYSVLMYDEDSYRQTVLEVVAKSDTEAFTKAAEQHPELVLVTCIRGVKASEFIMPGDSQVDCHQWLENHSNTPELTIYNN